MSKNNSKRQEFRRRVVGINVLGGIGKNSLPQCWLIYEVDYRIDDGDGQMLRIETKLERGRSIRTAQGFDELNLKKPSKRLREEWKLRTRPDLADHIQAAALLLRTLTAACAALDAHHGIKEH